MKYHEVESSNIEKVGHDKEDRLLEITFKSGGCYWYQDFSEGDLAYFLEAESQGKHFHKHIRNKFAFVKVTHFVQDVEFEAIILANTRLSGKVGHMPFNMLCEKHDWEFLETWDKTLGRSVWYARQNQEYKDAVEERIKQL